MRNQLGCVLAVTTLALFLFLGDAAADFTTPDGYVFRGPYRAEVSNIGRIGAFQRCQYWCWAACSEVLTRSQGFCVPQEYFVARVYGPSIPCRPADIPFIVSALNAIYPTDVGGYVRLTARGIRGAPQDVSLILNELGSGRPFLLGLTTHAVICYGVTYYELFDIFGRYYGPRIFRLDFQDPYYIWDPLNNPAFNFLDLSNPQNAAYISGIVTIDSEPVYTARIWGQPQSQVVAYGSRVTLQVGIDGTTPLHVSWYRDGKKVGSSGSTLTIRMATFRDAGRYQAVVSNFIGSTNSQIATITVVDIPPVFQIQPKSQTKKSGANVKFITRAKSRVMPTYQWYFNGSLIPGAVKPTLGLNRITSANAGEYRVVARNPAGDSTSETAVLAIIP